MKLAALSHGATGCTISGAGPTAVCVGHSASQVTRAVTAMMDAFQGESEGEGDNENEGEGEGEGEGPLQVATAVVCEPDWIGARHVEEFSIPKGNSIFIK